MQTAVRSGGGVRGDTSRVVYRYLQKRAVVSSRTIVH